MRKFVQRKRQQEFATDLLSLSAILLLFIFVFFIYDYVRVLHHREVYRAICVKPYISMRRTCHKQLGAHVSPPRVGNGNTIENEEHERCLKRKKQGEKVGRGLLS